MKLHLILGTFALVIVCSLQLIRSAIPISNNAESDNNKVNMDMQNYSKSKSMKGGRIVTFKNSFFKDTLKLETDISFDVSKFNFQSCVRNYEDLMTSSPSNRPDLINKPIDSTSVCYGFYGINSPSMKRWPLMAGLFVSYNRKPWQQDDDSQKLLVLVVKDTDFRNAPTNVRVGDKISSGQMENSESVIIENYLYRTFDGYTMAIEMDGNLVNSFIIWESGTIEINQDIHTKIKGLKNLT